MIDPRYLLVLSELDHLRARFAALFGPAGPRET
jgi:hypothetical protein